MANFNIEVTNTGFTLPPGWQANPCEGDTLSFSRGPGLTDPITVYVYRGQSADPSQLSNEYLLVGGHRVSSFVVGQETTTAQVRIGASKENPSFMLYYSLGLSICSAYMYVNTVYVNSGGFSPSHMAVHPSSNIWFMNITTNATVTLYVYSDNGDAHPLFNTPQFPVPQSESNGGPSVSETVIANASNHIYTVTKTRRPTGPTRPDAEGSTITIKVDASSPGSGSGGDWPTLPDPR